MLLSILNIIFILSASSAPSAEELVELKEVDSVQGSLQKIMGVDYYFGEENVTWYEAFAKCRSVGGFLASVEELNETIALLAHFVDNNFSKNTWWLSGADFHKKGDLYWYGTGHALKGFAWYKPVDDRYDESCLRLRYHSRVYESVYWPCDTTSRYLCEFEKSKSVVDGELEDKSTPFKKVGEKFYYLSKERSSWHKAFLSCRSMGSNLASISGSSEMEELTKHLVKGNSSLKQWWVSGAKFNEDTNFVWYGTGKEFNYTNWSEFECSELKIPNRCVQLWYEAFGYKMAVYPCNMEFYYICEITNVVSKS